jgi:hypothetical protein
MPKSKYRFRPFALSSFRPFVLSCLLLFCFSCKPKKAEIIIIPDAQKNHLQRAHLFGNINCIETDSYYYKDSLYVYSNKTVYFYSSDGYLTQVIVLDKDNDTVSKKIIHYLPNAQEDYWKEFRNKEVTTDTFIYNNYGFKSEEWFLVNDAVMYKIQYKTDAIGSIIEMKRQLPNYQLTNKMYYNEYGLLDRIEEFDPQDKLFKFITIEYDNYGDEVNRRAYKNNNEIIEYTYTQYNNEGLLQKIIFEDRLHNWREDKIYTQHDTKGNWLQEVVLQGEDTLMKRVRRVEYY